MAYYIGYLGSAVRIIVLPQEHGMLILINVVIVKKVYILLSNSSFYACGVLI